MDHAVPRYADTQGLPALNLPFYWSCYKPT